MRVIPTSDLPSDYHHLSVIHINERNRYKRLSKALERTLESCSEMRTEYESHTLILRENSQKEGFISGFELFITQLIDFLGQYEQRQNARLTTLRSNLLNSIKESFHDTVIVERIIHNLQVHCNQQKPLRIIIPKAVKLPDCVEHSNYIFSDDSNITIQNDMDSIRFPIDSVCQQWIKKADKEIYPLTQEISELIPKMLANIAQIFSHPNEKTMPHEPTLHSEDLK